MPAKNRLKTYVPESYYHLYNRGVQKQRVFRDSQDYSVFLSYLKTYLEPKDLDALNHCMLDQEVSYKVRDQARQLLRMNNFSDQISLLCYSLMPNHFHFLLYQKGESDIDFFMNSLGTRYSMYMNKKYKFVGPLFQSVYKGVLIDTDEQLLYTTRYIHRNIIDLPQYKILASKGQAFRGYLPSSYLEYLGLRKTKWVHPEIVLSYFSKRRGMTYESFVEESDDELSQRIIYEKTIDD